MRVEPAIKRVVAFIDGQNLFHSVKGAFGYSYPNYDVRALSEAICQRNGWELKQVQFYTGIPKANISPPWHRFWANKIRAMKHQGIITFTRPLRYTFRNNTPYGQEKGIDVRIALDVIGGAYSGTYDVALIFSQDQDLSEVVEDVRYIADSSNRWLKIASSFPKGGKNRRGINNTDWQPFDKTLYDQCIDHRDYRLKREEIERQGVLPGIRGEFIK